MNLNDFLAQLPDGIYELVARIALVIVAFLLIIILRRILTWVILRPLRRLVKKGGYNEDDKSIVDVVASPMRFFVVALALVISIQLIPTTAGINNLVFGIARSFIIIALLFFVYNLVDLLAPSSLRIANLTGFAIEDRLLPFIRVAVKLLILALGIVIILQEWI
jgi:MscS family membrane protein